MGGTARVFGPGGALARAHPSYEHRPGQEAMAEAVAATLDAGGVTMIEAGTGTGKTLAYLVPAVESGRRVIVSTGTRNLQDQIHDLDLPFLRDRLGLKFTAVVMKGRENYLCRYRLAEFEREPLFEALDERRFLPVIAAWGRTTATGDRAEIADLPDDLRLWRDVNARADTCTGSRCPEYDACWLTRVKRAAQSAQIVVVNHHLFFADLGLRSAFGSVLPDYDTVVFDEAHLLEEIATLYFGVQASAGQVEDLARDAERLAAAGGGPAKGGGGASVLRDAARELFAPLRERLRLETGRVKFEPEDRGGPSLDAAWASLALALDGVSRDAAGAGGPGEAGDSVAQRAEQLKDALEAVLDRRRAGFVYGMEARGRANVLLTASPIDVSQPLRERLFVGLRAAVLTSATLTVEGKFDFFRARLGLADAETLIVDSPFDHARQAVLYLPAKMPEPREPAFMARATAEIRGLLAITGGRAFLLFTSYANLTRCREALEDDGEWTILSQGEGSKVALVERFKRTPRAVLLGTASFWHGVDVPGEALSLVVVDKLPFDVPGDPLVAARIDRIREDGGNPFAEYQTPMAVLELKQGLGRLLRSTSDRGILAVLDPRITTTAYGKTFLKSLPPYRQVRRMEDCQAFFAPRA